ncbi:uncharacterized protein EV420DRAFT_1499280 [Desarmillaria tabescens]|uniref:DUF8191 domain-containing protein n=1 Tax=Armillaria tabescens TaxID=1929756 RepID=A0AA39TYR0_ARMTA|nr:uncharacterized protein EV420DRAFT_1499280 [Desarmillaria tabescens]KAK0470248.1 hypothetical protein EV420DRAFT_1499280 [Desarmillaria tabescens]
MPLQLERENERLRQLLAQSRRETAQLRGALRAFVDNNGDSREDHSGDEPDEDYDMASQESDASDEEDETISHTELSWDNAERVYRCPKCHYEVIDGVCQGRDCATLFAWTEEHDKMLGEAAPTDENCAMSLDRALVQRGTTPLNDLPLDLPVPDIYANSPTEFQSLMRRGATVAMCLRYKLRFTRKHGIVARADEDLFDLFNTPTMEETDQWQIYLGRRIQLHSNDEDGREFLIDLLEDALIYPLRSEFSNCFPERWETFVKDPSVFPVVWITRPMSKSGPGGADFHEDSDDSADDVPDFEVNGQPNVVGSYWEHDLIRQAQDAALDPTYGGWNRPPIGYVWDAYESESEEDEDAHEDDPTTREGSWDPTQEDKAFPSDYEEDDMEGVDGNFDEVDAEDNTENFVGEYEMDGEMDEEGDETTSGVVVVRQEDDIAGSDFDSDEELSGDEFVMGRTV